MAPVRLTNTHPSLPLLLDKLSSTSPSLRLVASQGEVVVSRAVLCLASPFLRQVLPTIQEWEHEVLLLPFCSSRSLGLLVSLLQEGLVLVCSRQEQGEVLVAARLLGITLKGLEVLEEKGEQEMVLEEQEVSLEESIRGPVKQEESEWSGSTEYSEVTVDVPPLKTEYGQDLSPRLESESSTSSLVIANITSLRPSSYSPPPFAAAFQRPDSYSPSPSVGMGAEVGARVGCRQLSVQEKEAIVRQAVVDKVALENLAALNGVPVGFVRKLVTEGIRPNQQEGRKQGVFCKKCPFQTTHKDHLYKHIADYHRGKKVGGPNDCDFCRVRFTNPVKFHLHMREMHSKEVLCCPECEFTAFKGGDIKKHLAKIHNMSNNAWIDRSNVSKLQNEKFPCNICKLVVNSDKALTQHKRDKHNMVNIPVCQMSRCNRQRCALRHPTICKAFMEGTCTYNPCEFRHEMRRESPNVANTEPRQANPRDPRLNKTSPSQPEFQNTDGSFCSDCDAIFTSKAELEKHQKTHRFACLSCSKCVTSPLERSCESHLQNIVKK